MYISVPSPLPFSGKVVIACELSLGNPRKRLKVNKLEDKVVKNKGLARLAELAMRMPPQAFDLFSVLLEV
jgi:hypothetical protein